MWPFERSRAQKHGGESPYRSGHPAAGSGTPSFLRCPGSLQVRNVVAVLPYSTSLPRPSSVLDPVFLSLNRSDLAVDRVFVILVVDSIFLDCQLAIGQIWQLLHLICRIRLWSALLQPKGGFWLWPCGGSSLAGHGFTALGCVTGSPSSWLASPDACVRPSAFLICVRSPHGPSSMA